MSVSIVQSKVGTAGQGTSHTATFPGPTTTGNTIAVAICWGMRTGTTFSGINSLTDGTNIYTRWTASAVTQGASADYSGSATEFWYCENITGAAAPTIAAAFANLCDGMVTAWELSPSTHDQASTGAGSTTSAACSPLTPSQNGAAALAAAFLDDTLGSWVAGDGPGTNYTLDGGAGFASAEFGSEHWLQTTATAATGAFTFKYAYPWVASQAIFVPSGGATPNPQVAAGFFAA